jgi:DNA modification methylase
MGPSVTDLRLAVDYIPIGQLRPAEWNPRRLPKTEREKLRRSLEAFGAVDPAVVNRSKKKALDWLIVGGHQRVLVAGEDLGWTEFPCVFVHLDDEDQLRLLNVALNRIAGEWHEDLLAELLDGLSSRKVDLSLTGFDQGEIDRLLAGLRASLADPDEAPEPPKDPISRPGDLWTLGEHRLICGDSTDPDVVARLFAGEEDQLLVTDPPYGIDYAELVAGRLNQKKGGWKGFSGDALSDDELRTLVVGGLSPSKAPTAFVWHPVGPRRRLFWDAVEESGWRITQEIVWVKNRIVFGQADYQWCHEACLYAKRKGARRPADRKASTVWTVAKLPASMHPTQKPVELYVIPIRNHTRSGEIVYDPFAGSGTVLVAAEGLRRRGYAVELDPAYCDVAIGRWQQVSGRQAVREDGTPFPKE